MSFMYGKWMADPRRGGHIDQLLRVEDMSYCYTKDMCFSADSGVEARDSGWSEEYLIRIMTHQLCSEFPLLKKAGVILQCF